MTPSGINVGPAVAALSLLALPALAQDNQAAIDDALSAAPPQVTEDAKVMTMEGEVLREGTGAYTCLPGVEGGPGPMCLDAEWMRWADAWMNKKEFEPQGVGPRLHAVGRHAGRRREQRRPVRDRADQRQSVGRRGCT